MKTYKVVFVFDSEEENKWDALAEWYRKDYVLQDNDDFVTIKKKLRRKHDSSRHQG